jgi:hypothetical protein
MIRYSTSTNGSMFLCDRREVYELSSPVAHHNPEARAKYLNNSKHVEYSKPIETLLSPCITGLLLNSATVQPHVAVALSITTGDGPAFTKRKTRAVLPSASMILSLRATCPSKRSESPRAPVADVTGLRSPLSAGTAANRLLLRTSLPLRPHATQNSRQTTRPPLISQLSHP